jgi:hypothetical protein
MTWDLLRLDLPNCAVILALALVPIASAASFWPQSTDQATVSARFEPGTTVAHAASGKTGPTAGAAVVE